MYVRVSESSFLYQNNLKIINNNYTLLLLKKQSSAFLFHNYNHGL